MNRFAPLLLLFMFIVFAHRTSAAPFDDKTDKTALLILPAGADGKPRVIRKPLGLNGQAEITREDAPPGTLFTLLKRSPDGTVQGNPIKPIGVAAEDISIASCIESPRSAAHEKLQLLDEKAIKALIEIRRKKIELLGARLRAELKGPLLDQLRSYESRFGLLVQPALSPELSVDIITWRLLFIRSMLLNNTSS